VLFDFVVLHLVSSVLYQEIGWKERLRNDLFCVEWDVKLELCLSVSTLILLGDRKDIWPVKTSSDHLQKFAL